MQRVKLFLGALIIAALTIITPGRALSELNINPDSWSYVSGNEVLNLHFSGSSSEADITISDESLAIDGPSTSEMGYWFKDMPWLGVTAETALSSTNQTISETDMEADTDFDPLNSFILLRYAHGPFQPFLGVGPTLLISNFGSNNTYLIHHLFMGFNYAF